jgi:DNA-binding response OmpR family regulator
VDDEPLLRLTVGSDLQDAGYVVKTAEDGHLACAELAENSYDLVVTDLVMEGIDGMQVLQEAKRCDATCGVILMTGYGDMDSVIEALRYGADDYLLKPTNVKSFFFVWPVVLRKGACNEISGKRKKNYAGHMLNWKIKYISGPWNFR